MKPIWQHLDVIQRNGPTSDPGARDRARVEAMFTELYRLGERPTLDAFADYFATEYGSMPEERRRTLLKLWSKRLRTPNAGWRGKNAAAAYEWRYPFLFADEYVSKHDLESIASRLADQAAEAARGFAEVIDRAPGTDEAEAAEDELRAAAHALSVWGLVLDRSDDEGWYGPHVLPPRRTQSERMRRSTRRGRARYDAWISRITAERDESERESD